MGHWAILVPSSMKTKGHIILSILSFQEARKEVVDIIVNVSKETTTANFFLKWSTAFSLGLVFEDQLFLVLPLFLRGWGVVLEVSVFHSFALTSFLSVFLVRNLAVGWSAHSWCDNLVGLACWATWGLSILEMPMISISKEKNWLVGNWDQINNDPFVCVQLEQKAFHQF